jgi:hypothetical protein
VGREHDRQPGIVTVACLLASVVVVWLTDISVNCPPEAFDCL